jgi:hypothetical protein
MFPPLLTLSHEGIGEKESHHRPRLSQVNGFILIPPLAGERIKRKSWGENSCVTARKMVSERGSDTSVKY